MRIKDRLSLEMNQTELHKKHEDFTDYAYNTPNILPHRYVFILTNLCNLHCDFCFQRKKIGKNNMTSQDWIDLAKQIPEYARITFCGGEPLLFPGFKEVFSYVAGRFDCNIISNGILLTHEKIDFILSFSEFRTLSLSIDNIGNTTRGVMPKEWDRLKKMMIYFVEKRNKMNAECILDIKTLILDKNAGDLFKIYKYFVEELRIDTHVFQFLKGSPFQHADYMVGFDDILKESKAKVYKNFDMIKEQLKLVADYNRKKGRISFLHPKVCSLISENSFSNIDYLNDEHHNKERYLPCRFPWSSVHINADGSLFPCLAISMGNVKKNSLYKIINSKNFIRFKDLIRKECTVEACNRCGWLRPKEALL